MYELFKQLFFGVVAFFYNRTKRMDKKVLMISIGAIGILFFFGLFLNKPDTLASNHIKSQHKTTIVNENSSEILIESLSNDNLLFDNEKIKQSKPISDEFENPSNLSMNNIEKNLEDAEAISLQATAISKSTGRPEPFAPIFAPGSMPSPDGSIGSLPGLPGMEGVKGPSAEEIARQKAEQRRNEIRESLNNNVLIKGIVLNKNKSKPMAVIQLSKTDGTNETKAVMPGEQIYLPNCVAKVSNIAENRIGLQSEDVKVDRYLPEINDEELSSASGAAPSPSGGENPTSSGGLMPPPTPGAPPMPTHSKGTAPNNSSMGDAKTKIDEIDKLLNSF